MLQNRRKRSSRTTTATRPRVGRLYRLAGYQRFEDYCQERWGWSRVHVHRQIEGAQVAAMLPIGNTPSNEAQARELARLREPETIREVWQAAQARGALIRRLRQEQGMSTRQIAAAVGVSHMTVERAAAGVTNVTPAANAAPEQEPPARVTGKDGKRYPACPRTRQNAR